MAFKVVYVCPCGAIRYNDNQVLCEDYCSGKGCMFGREFCKIEADERWLGKEKELFEYISAVRADVLSDDELSDMRKQMIEMKGDNYEREQN